MSPKQFNEEIGGPDLSTTARHFRQLRRWGYIEVALKRPGSRRGSAIETIYRAIDRAHLDLGTWEALPASARTEGSGPFLEALLTRIKQSIAADTMDADTDRHLSWKSLLLDQQAWTECTHRLEAVSEWLNQLERESADRLGTPNNEEIPATVSLLSFRSPQPALGKIKRTP